MSVTAGDARAGGRARSAAVIDVGSNSVLLLAVTVEPDGRLTTRDEAAVITRLGAGLRPGGRLDATARERTRDTVLALAARARGGGAGPVWALATAAVRDAVDGGEFAREITAVSGVPVAVLSGEEEARLAYTAVAGEGAAASDLLLVVDLGGRSTELTLGRGGHVLAGTSLPLGALVLTETCLRSDPPHPEELAAAAGRIDDVLTSAALVAQASRDGAGVVAVGGTATTLAALDLALPAFDASRVHGHRLAHARLRTLLARLVAVPAAARGRLPGVEPDRAAILPAGVLVLERLLAASGAGTLRVSSRGVRHAYLLERLAEAGVLAAPGEGRP